jgi:hypothetical protein
MIGSRVGLLSAGVLLVASVLPAGALAGEEHTPPGCPPASYSKWHYWAPGTVRLYWHCHDATLSVYPPHPPYPPRYLDVRFPCPAVDPALLPRNLALTPGPAAATPSPAAPSGTGSGSAATTMPPARP